MNNKITFTVDVEPDLHNESQYEGITEGLKRFESICDKNNIKPVLFVTANCIKKYPKIFKALHKKGWEISLHGLTHKRFDEMPFSEKEHEIKESIRIFKKYIGTAPKGFRAPQHSIDDKTLDLLEKYKIKYDSSYTPLNLLQLFFFPRKFRLWLKTFFSPLNPYKIRKNLLEIPPSSMLVPFVSLTLRVLPKWCLFFYVKNIKFICRHPVFYAHSWDFIKLEKSRIDRTFSHTKLLNKLDYIMSIR